MRALPSALRKQLETAVLAARRAAESASRAALDGLGVFADRRPEHLDADQAALRNGLRAKWRQLGGDRELLVAECAYEQWHRLLFARFLAENDLLLHPSTRRRSRSPTARSWPPSWASLTAGRSLPASPPRSCRASSGSTTRASRFASHRRAGSARADPRRPAGRDLHRRRRARLGLPVLAEGQEGRGQRLGAQDRWRRPRTGDAAVHRELHGPVPARELARRLVGGPAPRQPAGQGLRVPPLRRRRAVRRPARSTVGPTASPRSR